MKARGCVAWKAGAGAFRVGDRYVKMGHRGVADIIGVIPWCAKHDKPALSELNCVTVGRFLAIEVKAKDKQPTPEQAAFLASVRQAGGLAFVATSCEDVCRALGWSFAP